MNIVHRGLRFSGDRVPCSRSRINNGIFGIRSPIILSAMSQVRMWDGGGFTSVEQLPCARLAGIQPEYVN